MGGRRHGSSRQVERYLVFGDHRTLTEKDVSDPRIECPCGPVVWRETCTNESKIQLFVNYCLGRILDIRWLRQLYYKKRQWDKSFTRIMSLWAIHMIFEAGRVPSPALWLQIELDGNGTNMIVQSCSWNVVLFMKNMTNISHHIFDFSGFNHFSLLTIRVINKTI